MSQQTELQRAIRRVLDLDNKLSGALAQLSDIATEIYGEDLQADICEGSEIEFRRRGDDGYFDSFDCIRLEDIESRL